MSPLLLHHGVGGPGEGDAEAAGRARGPVLPSREEFALSADSGTNAPLSAIRR
jgi:hypothetical protein